MTADDPVVDPVVKPAAEAPSRPIYRVGDPLPQVMDITDMAAVIGVSVYTARMLEAEGELRRFELERVGKRPRYCGKKVQAWADGAGVQAGRPHFGRKR